MTRNSPKRGSDRGRSDRAWQAPRWFVAGSLALTVASLAALALAVSHLAGVGLPGCGPDSGCAALARSAWGRVPGTAWPVSFLGTAWFLGLLVAWLATARGVPTALARLLRLGALTSVGFLLAMGSEGHVCGWCLIAHAGSLGALLASEARGRPALAGRRPLLLAAAVFVGVSLVLGGLWAGTEERAGRAAEAELAAATQAIVQAGEGRFVAGPAGSPEEPVWGPNGFVGRQRLGPAQAPIRLVIFSDYQCADCKRVEAEAMALLSSRTDMSLSVKHFPFSVDCNPHVGSTLHRNACWAARAVEAAARIGGPDAFWAMHHWLFERAGSFTAPEMRQYLATTSMDAATFFRTMESAEVLSLVQADIEEAIALGIHYTPMVFVNGVELKGWSAPSALTRMVTQVAAARPPAADARGDDPPLAATKYVEDWVAAPRVQVPPDSEEHSLGAIDPRVDVVLWGDYQEPDSARVDGVLRQLLEQNSDLRYSFRAFPMDQQCNTFTQRSPYPLGCRAARAAGAAHRLGGPEAFWCLHRWLMVNPAAVVDDAALGRAAESCGLDGEAFLGALADPALELAIQDDVRSAQRVGLQSVPWIMVDGRRVPRWELAGDQILERVLERARAARQP